ncbi:hypothetical protein ACRJ4B_14645 [Streptomyces sp. GTA36]
MALHDCDLLDPAGVGARFDDRVTGNLVCEKRKDCPPLILIRLKSEKS